jgi:methionyl-tRNA formyltransferase
MKSIFFIGKNPMLHNFISSAKRQKFFSTIHLLEDCAHGRSELSQKKKSASSGIEYVSVLTEADIRSYIFEHYADGSLLISFDNFIIIGQELCKLFEGKAANFHPAPLPHYKGVNSVSWALYNNERTWSHSWHRISEEVDEGDILSQAYFDIDEDATQTSVMTNCLIGAARDFDKILETLISGVRNESPPSSSALKIQEKYYSFKDSPDLDITRKDIDLELVVKSIPISPYAKWRWTVTLSKNVRVGYISQEETPIPAFFDQLDTVPIGEKKYLVNIIKE